MVSVYTLSGRPAVTMGQCQLSLCLARTCRGVLSSYMLNACMLLGHVTQSAVQPSYL